MYDIHCHLAYGVSDGPRERELALAMLQQAKENGIAYINAVAHYGPWAEEVPGIVDSLRPEAEALGIELHSGMEYDFSHLLENQLAWRTIGPESHYLLCDFNSNRIPFSAKARFRELAREGYGIVIVHPETLFGSGELAALEGLKDARAVIQINASNLLPEAQPRIRSMARNLLRRNLVDAVASDSHRPEGSRRNRMAEARQLVAAEFGEATARVLFDINPQRLLADKAPFDTDIPALPWWKKILGRN